MILRESSINQFKLYLKFLQLAKGNTNDLGFSFFFRVTNLQRCLWKSLRAQRQSSLTFFRPKAFWGLSFHLHSTLSVFERSISLSFFAIGTMECSNRLPCDNSRFFCQGTQHKAPIDIMLCFHTWTVKRNSLCKLLYPHSFACLLKNHSNLE